MAISSAVFGQFLNATFTGGTGFTFGSVISTSATIYANDPSTTSAASGTTFAGNGSSKSVWIQDWTNTSSTTYLQAELTNGEQKVGGSSTAEDLWVIKIGTSYYVLTSGGYTVTAGGSDNINASISLTDLDQLATEQAAADVTAPTLSSSNPTDGATGVSLSNNLTLTFSESVVAGTGQISLYDATDTLIESFNVATGVGSAGGSVSFSASTVVVNPNSNLTGSTSYYLKVDATTVKDSAGNAYAGISSSTGLDFTTAAGNTAPTLTTVSTLTGFSENTATEITYATLASAADDADPEGDAISFRIETVSAGTLKKWNGSSWVAVTAGTTTVAAGEKLQWTPASNTSGSALNAFTVKAWDGSLASATAIQVKADVSAAPAPDPGPPPPVQLDADLNLNSNTGASNDRITSDIQPDFDINAGKLLSAGQTARLLDASGKLVSATTVTTEQVSAGKVTLPTPSTLDDGTYTYTAQILDTTGRVIGERLITIQIVTDKDGVMPSVELAANGGDFNKDGIPDWQQANVTQLPLKSLSQFLLGKDAQKDSFGAVLVGAPDLAAQGGIQLNASAQLVDVKLVDTPASKPLPTGVQATSAMFAFTVQAQDGATLPDANARAGLQVQTVIALPQGVKADAFMKFNPATQAWVNYANPRALTGAADGAALLDTNGDGLIDRIVVTVTDGGPGDEDGMVNGIVVDPGLLADTGTSSSLVSLKDRDGVAADVERATANHDYNQDGIEDWDQGAIAQLPLASMDAYLQGKDAPLASFGTVMVGKYDSTSPISAKIDANGQLLNVAVAPVGKAAPTGFKAVSPVLEVKAAAADGAASLTDIDPTREGLQTQVIQYFTTGVKANAFLLFDAASRTWFDYSDPTSIDGSSDGAALLDFNKDGLVDAAVITITDSGVADDDLTINGVISLHGMLGWYGV